MKKQLISKDFSIEGLDHFTERINASPPDKEVRINKHAGNSKYLPISNVQMKLDEHFLGIWSWEVNDVKVIANEVLVWGHLKVFHPIANVWITRAGTGAAMIQQRSKAEVNDINAKIKNTLGKDFPHAEVEALKNAARKLGKAFGRDLNRDFADEYTSVGDTVAAEENFEQVVRDKMNECKSVAELRDLMTQHKEWETSDYVLAQFTKRKKQIEK